MLSSTSNSNHNRVVPWALSIALACVAMIEMLVWWRGYPVSGTLYANHKTPSMEESVVQWQVTRALESTEPVDVIVIGDSSCLMGIRPRVIEETTGLSTINVGTIATLYTDGHADILEEIIEQRGVPGVVVYHTSAIYGVGFYGKKEIDETGLLRNYRLWRGIRPEGIAYAIPSVRRFRNAAQNLLPSLFINQQHQQGFLEASRGPYPSDVEMEAMVERLHGGMIEPEQWDWTQEQPEEARSLHYNTDIFPGLRRIAALAMEHDFELVVAFNPMPEAYRSSAFEAKFSDYLAKFKAELPASEHVRYLTPALRYYADDLCGTVCHLNDLGAHENSRQIAQWLLEFEPTR